MYNVVKDVLNAGGYNLTNILKKIDSLWTQDKLTNEQHTELIELARNGANIKHSVDIIAKFEEFDKRLKVLENAKSQTDSTEKPIEEFVVGKWYYNSDKCTFEGKTYACTAPEGVACVWSPKDYPAYWESEE